MNEVIEQLAKQLKQYENANSSSASQPNENDTQKMLIVLKDLISIKGRELSSYNLLLCYAAHSLGNKEIELFNSLCSECKSNIDDLEKLHSVMKSIAY